MVSAVFLTLTFAVLVIAKMAAGISTCEADFDPPTRSATLSCRFMKIPQDGYRITFCHKAGGEFTCDKHVLCNLVKSEGGSNLRCTFPDPFQNMICQASILDLICHVPDASSWHAGTYTCDLVPQEEGQDPCPCRLSVPAEKYAEKDEIHTSSADGWKYAAIVEFVVIFILVIVIVRLYKSQKLKWRALFCRNTEDDQYITNSASTPATNPAANPRTEEQNPLMTDGPEQNSQGNQSSPSPVASGSGLPPEGQQGTPSTTCIPVPTPARPTTLPSQTVFQSNTFNIYAQDSSRMDPNIEGYGDLIQQTLSLSASPAIWFEKTGRNNLTTTPTTLTSRPDTHNNMDLSGPPGFNDSDKNSKVVVTNSSGKS